MPTRVLIADDTPFVRELLMQSLHNFGLDVVAEAIDGEDAIKKYLSLKPDLTFLDIVMPVKSGLKVIEEIRAQVSDAKIIAMSTEGAHTFVKDAEELGAVFLTKPFSLDSLKAAISLVGIKV